MKWKRCLALVAACCIPAALVPCLAQDADGDPEKKERRNRLYVEGAFGAVESDDINASIQTTSQNTTESFVALDDNGYARAIIGWKLQKNKGSFRFRFEGYNEEDWSMNTTAASSNVANTNQQGTAPVLWWTVNAQPGSTRNLRFTPSWDSSRDFNGNGQPDPDEVEYEENPDGSLKADLEINGSAPNTLENQLQVFDAYFMRRFGGRKLRAYWTGGLRYFVYEGNISQAAWLNIDFAGVGFSDGGLLRLMTMNQDTSGAGPNFSIELQRGFLRDRIVIWGQARGAFVLQSLTVKSSSFFTLVRGNEGAFVPVDGNLKESLDKSSWHTGLEIGFSAMLLEGFHIHFAGMIHAFQDSVLLPSDIAIPQNAGQAVQGTDGVFNTQDLQYEGFYAGLSFQF